MNQYNVVHGETPPEPQREYNSQLPEFHFKYPSSKPDHSPVVSTITGRLNLHAAYHGDVKVFS